MCNTSGPFGTCTLPLTASLSKYLECCLALSDCCWLIRNQRSPESHFQPGIGSGLPEIKNSAKEISQLYSASITSGTPHRGYAPLGDCWRHAMASVVYQQEGWSYSSRVISQPCLHSRANPLATFQRVIFVSVSTSNGSTVTLCLHTL